MPAKCFSQRVLIAAFFLFFAFGSLFLFWQNHRERDPSFEKNWWSLAFTEPRNQEVLNFRVKNYARDQNFSYRVLREDRVVEEGRARLLSGASFAISVSNSGGSPAIIEVTAEDGRVQSINRK